MKDRYLILRFIGFYLLKENILKNVNGDIIDYKGDIDEFLGKIMDYINDMSDEEVANLRSNFIRTMKNNQIVFGDNAFRRVSKKVKATN